MAKYRPREERPPSLVELMFSCVCIDESRLTCVRSILHWLNRQHCQTRLQRHVYPFMPRTVLFPPYTTDGLFSCRAATFKGCVLTSMPHERSLGSLSYASLLRQDMTFPRQPASWPEKRWQERTHSKTLLRRLRRDPNHLLGDVARLLGKRELIELHDVHELHSALSQIAGSVGQDSRDEVSGTKHNSGESGFGNSLVVGGLEIICQ